MFLSEKRKGVMSQLNLEDLRHPRKNQVCSGVSDEEALQITLVPVLALLQIGTVKIRAPYSLDSKPNIDQLSICQSKGCY